MKMKKSEAKSKRDVANKSEKIVKKVSPVGASRKKSQNADNKNLFLCVLCEETFAEHNLMIEHFRLVD